jgi:hypothetical protein
MDWRLLIGRAKLLSRWLAALATAALHSIAQATIPFLVPAGVSVYLLWAIPPIWLGLDSICLLCHDIHMEIPHYPPGYVIPIHYLSYLTAGRMESVRDCIPVADGALVYAILVAQHLLLAVAITTFACAIARTWPRRLLAAGCLTLCGTTFLYNHAILTEATTASLLILLLAAAYRCYDRGFSWPALLLYHLVLVPFILQRHSNMVFAVLLPLVYLLDLMFKAPRRTAALRLGITLFGAMAALGVSKIAFVGICKAYDVEYRSIFGRAFLYQIYTANRDRTSSELDREIARLQARTSDPVIREAIPLIFRSQNPWLEQYNLVAQLLETHHPEWLWEARMKKTDHVLNRVSWLYIFSLDPAFLRVVTLNFWLYLIGSDRIMANMVEGSAINADIYTQGTNPEYAILSFFEPELRPGERYESFLHSWYYRATFWIRDGYLLVAVAIAWLMGTLWARRNGNPVSNFVPAIVAAGLLHLAAVSIVTCMLPRYALPTTVALFAALAVLASQVPIRTRVAMRQSAGLLA